MTSSNGNVFRVTGLLCGEFTAHCTKASDAELWCFLWSASEPTVEKTMETPVIWDTIALIMTSLWLVASWCHEATSYYLTQAGPISPRSNLLKLHPDSFDIILWTIHISQSNITWRHNGCYSVSNHQPHGSLLNRLFKHRSKKTSKLHVTGLCLGNSPRTGEFPAQMASNAENVSNWWRHREYETILITTRKEEC